MMQLDWDATINSLRDSIPQSQFQNWVKPLTLIRCEENSVVLGVPNRFHEEWVVNHYAEKLKSAIHRQAGKEVQLEFEVFVERSNKEAAQSETPGQNNPQANPQRPTLRLVEAGGQNAGATESPEPILPPAPQLPKFGTPYWELEFNKMASQCAKMIYSTHCNSLALTSLFIVADVGMGKTHLLTEIGEKLYQNNPRIRVRYTNAESFTSDMVQGFKTNDIYSFKKKYRDEVDILLFDDLHGLSGRTRSQEELLHIFNDLMTKGGQGIFAAKAHPHSFENFIDPLKSRLLSSVITDVTAPSYQERVSLLKLACEHNLIDTNEETLKALADHGQKDVRELLGSLIRLHLQAKIENRKFDRQFLGNMGWQAEVNKQQVTVEQIIGLIEHTFGVSRMDLISKSRKSSVTWARQVAMFLARHYTLYPLEKIGEIFGRDHATVIHAFAKVAEAMKQYPARKYEVEYLKEKLSAHAGQPEE